MNRLTGIIIGVVAAVCMVACRPGTPSRFIQPADMEDILVDYHTARAMANATDQRDYNQALYVEAVLKKHGVTREEFDSSLVYYYTRADRFDAMYKRVAERLDDRALAMGATEGEIGKYASLNANGDTANIWPERRMMMLTPMPPYNRMDFEIEADSTFREGDSFLLQFMADFTYQSGAKEGMLYVAVCYADTTVVRQLRMTYSGLVQQRIESTVTADIQAIRGFFYLGGGSETSTMLRLLFINNVQLIRFHKAHEEQQQHQADSLALDTLPQREGGEMLGGRDSAGHRLQLLPAHGGTAPDRMVQRRDTARRRL